MHRRLLHYGLSLLTIAAALTGAVAPAHAADKKAQPKASKPPAIEPQAAQALKQMTEYLKGLRQFTVQADITEDVLLDTGIRIQDGRSVAASVRRPDRLRVDSAGDVDERQLVYDGKTMILMDLRRNVYSSIDVPPEIDAALNHAIQAYNLRAPLADLIYAKAYDYLTEGALAGFYLGVSKVQGIPCHHLVFKQKDIDWQIWIETSPTPVPRKFLVTDKKAKGLQFTALLSEWNPSPQLEDSVFVFTAPAEAKKVDLRPRAAAGGTKGTKK